MLAAAAASLTVTRACRVLATATETNTASGMNVMGR